MPNIIQIRNPAALARELGVTDARRGEPRRKLSGYSREYQSEYDCGYYAVRGELEEVEEKRREK